MDATLAGIIADLLTNLASGWIGASIIFPVTTKLPKKFNFAILIFNLFIATVLLITVYLIKSHHV